MYKKILKAVAHKFTFMMSEFVPKKKSLVLFHGATISHYNESSRYLFEYIQNKGIINAFWMTDRKDVYAYLTSKEYNVIYHKSLKGIWAYLRSGIVIGTGTSYPSLLSFVGRKTIKICLHHGMGPRSTNAIDEKYFKSPLQVLKKLNKFDFFNFTSEFNAITIGKLQYLLPESKRLVLGYPRCDHLLNKEYVKRCRNDKKFTSKVFPEFNASSKIILYSPTWRPSNGDQRFPLEMFNDYELESFNKWLEIENIFLLVSIHPMVDNLVDFSKCNRIKILTSDYLFDINAILPEIDLLITDYSSIATDYLLMKRPVIYVMPDYDFYLYKYGLLEDMRKNLPGREAKSFSEILSLIKSSLENNMTDASIVNDYLSKYYDVDIINSCERHYQFIHKLVTKR